MAVTLNANTSTGFIATSDTSGVLQLQTAGTTAVTVNASQNVGIGTASPSGISTYPTLDIRGSAGGGLRYGNATVHGYLYADSNGGQIGTATNSPFVLYSNGLERMRIPAAGGIQSVSSISVGNTAPTTSGAGITFPATQSASSDVNTLDDYEEGTWTPVLVPTSGSITTQTNSGAYTKIGGQVTVNFLCIINNVGTATALSSMSGLPFASNSAAGVGAGRESSSTGLMWQWLAGSGLTALSGWTYANNSAIATGYSLRGTLTYFV